MLKYGHNYEYLENQLTDRKNGTSSTLVFSMRFCRYAALLHLDYFEKLHYIGKKQNFK